MPSFSLSSVYQLIEDKKFSYKFLIFGLLIQVIAFIISSDPVLAFISGLVGVVSVVQCSEKKLTFYLWGFLQLFTFLALAIQENLYAKVVENVFYLVTMIIGLFIWSRNKEKTDDGISVVKPKKLPVNFLGGIISSLIILICCSTCILSASNDSQPFMDSLTTLPAIAAQILMISGYKEQWYFWGFVDVLSIVLWAIAGNYCMVAQYIFWTLNCVYGYLIWKKRTVK